MSKARTSVVWTMSCEEFSKLVATADSISEVTRLFGLAIAGANYKTIRQRILEDRIDTSHFYLKLSDRRAASRRASSGSIRRKLKQKTALHKEDKQRLISEGILENVCKICGSLPLWNGMPLALHLDHIDGDHYNNEETNIRLLCPNCHTQTPTYAGRNLRGKTPSVRYPKQKRPLPRMRKFTASKEEIEKMIAEMPMTAIGAKYGVSGNAVKKRCKVLNIQFPVSNHSYWLIPANRAKHGLPEIPTPPLTTKPITHGMAGYRRGCRCDTCRSKNNEKRKRLRHHKKQVVATAGIGPAFPA